MARIATLPGATRSTLWRVLGLATAIAFMSTQAWGQDASKVYDLADLSTMPKLASMSQATKLIQGSYPPLLKSSGVGGTVQMEMVVDKDGKVEPGSIETASSVPALAEAAKKVAEKLEFYPGKVKDTPVRTRVVLPVVYKP
ncbi:MAG: TonB family protein [Gemmatimonadetes bacterium]|nr:TonB family protein [Gemmatimonadota bacterium]MBI3567157.1 TonB family protein [Gemmatimonadota bacterium]